MIVLSHLSNTVLMGLLHRVKSSRFTQTNNLHEADGDILSCVDVVVVNSQNVVAVGGSVAVGVAMMITFSFLNDCRAPLKEGATT